MREIQVANGPVDATVRVPGSKSVSIRALDCAMLAKGGSELTGFLYARDTDAMIGCVKSLGAQVDDLGAGELRVQGLGGPPNRGHLTRLDALQSGATARFILPTLAAGVGEFILDGHDQLRARPFSQLTNVLRNMGADIEGDQLPLRVSGSSLSAAVVEFDGSVSSQFISAMMLAAPCLPDGLEIRWGTDVVSYPYVVMTQKVMEAFGAELSVDHQRAVVSGGGYAGTRYVVEPDASSASYFLALPMLLGGKVTVEGLGAESISGDMAFVSMLEQMGADVTMDVRSTTVTVSSFDRLRGIEVDMKACSDLAPTLAVVAAFVGGPTYVTGIGFIRNKESDRIGAIVQNLTTLGVDAEETSDGFEVYPGAIGPGMIETFDDHRIAMAFSLIGLVRSGISISQPECVTKTLPNFFDLIEVAVGKG